MNHIVAWESYYNTVKTELAATIYTPLFVLFMRCYSPSLSDCPAALRLTRVEVSSGAWNGAISGAGVFAGTQAGSAARPHRLRAGRAQADGEVEERGDIRGGAGERDAYAGCGLDNPLGDLDQPRADGGELCCREPCVFRQRVAHAPHQSV